MSDEDEPMKGRLYIPACGDRLRLTKDWTFDLYLEHRNMKFAKELALLQAGEGGYGVWERARYGKLARRKATLTAGTVIECDRVYIRQYNKGRISLENDYDSITWKVTKVKGKEGKGKPSGRFWVKLPDCYSVRFEQEFDSLYRNRVKLVEEVHSL